MAKKTSKRKQLSSTKATFSKLYGRKLTEEEESEIGRNLLRLARALGPTKKNPKKPKEEE